MAIKTDRQFNITKSDQDKRLVFGWANVAIRKDGEQIVDYQGDMFDPEDLEEAAYKYVLNFRDAGEEHIPGLRKKAKLVESVVFTKEKMAAMGLPEGLVPEGWWIGFKVHDDDAWEKIKNGTYRMFSIEGAGIREEVSKEDLQKSDMQKSFTFGEMLEKFNPYHDARGRFATSSGYASFTISTKDPKKQHMADAAITREKERQAASGADNERRITAAEDQLRTMLNEGAEVKLSGMDPAMAESTVNSIKSVIDRYPTTKDAFGGFTTDECDPGDFADDKGTMALFHSSTKIIHLNPKYYGNKEEFEKKYAETVEKNFHPKGTTADSVVVHEMGHAIDHYTTSKTIDRAKVMWNGDGVSSRIWNNAIDKGRKTGNIMTGKSVREELSGYAGKNAKEYLAEGFCEYLTSPSPRPTATHIGKRVEAYIKKAAKADQEV